MNNIASRPETVTVMLTIDGKIKELTTIADGAKGTISYHFLYATICELIALKSAIYNNLAKVA